MLGVPLKGARNGNAYCWIHALVWRMASKILGRTEYTLNPERHDIMSRGINCDGVYRMTPGQVTAARDHLYHERTRYLSASAPSTVDDDQL